MHVDMDAFYASLSCVDGRSCGNRRHRWWLPTGVVLSATYEARARGVWSGMSSTEARRLAPRATFVVPDFDSYSAVSRRSWLSSGQLPLWLSRRRSTKPWT